METTNSASEDEGHKPAMRRTRRQPRKTINIVSAVKAVGGPSPPSGGCVAARSVTRRTLPFRCSAPGAREAAGHAAELPLP